METIPLYLDTAVTLGGYTKSKSAVYSDDKENYIDADYNLGKVGVVSTTYEIKVQIANDKTWDEGPDYITRTADLSVFVRVKNTGPYVNVTDSIDFGSKSKHYTETDINGTGDAMSVTVMQKVSKAQASDDIDGIKYAKDVKTYFITDGDGVAKHLLGLADVANSDVDHSGYGLITGGTQGAIVSVYRSFAKMTQYAETINFKSENGYYYTDVDDSDSVEVESADGFVIGCGDLYALSKDGYIEEFIGKDSEYKKLYKVDGSMNKISISLPIFAAVWNEDDEVYSIITPGAPAKDATTTTATTTATKAGWAQAADKTWSFVKADGTKTTGWFQDATGTWYFAKAEGTMVANGWAQSGSAWYYLGGSGAMATNTWVQLGNDWYYVGSTGAMLTNTTVGGYTLGASGAWVK